MHAIWFSLIVPACIAAVWIAPGLRIPKLWFGLCLATMLATTIWLGMDLYQFVTSRGGANGLPLRVLYVFLSQTGKPVLQLMLGTFLAGVFCWRRSDTVPPGLASIAEVSTQA